MWVFDRNQIPRPAIAGKLPAGSQFSFEYVDPQTRPGLADKFGVKEFGSLPGMDSDNGCFRL